jgi:signal transduction histidine kinase/CheY-like chemotaxis protein
MLIAGGTPYSIDFRIVRPDGAMRHVQENAEIETSAGGKRRMIGTLQDVTEYKRLEEQFQIAQKLQTVGRLAGGVAHDFNNLLTVINGYTGLLLRREGYDRPTRVGLEEIRKAGDKGAMLTQQLLAFSSKQVVKPQVIDLNAIVGDMLLMLRRLIGETIELSTALDSATAVVKADPGQINQILMNLAVNARDAMPKGGRLLIQTSRTDLPKTRSDAGQTVGPGAYVMLAVTDTGIGMDEETRRHIFEPFFTTKEPGHGTGLGLSTVYGIVEQLGGSIWVDSEPGEGTTIRIYLPRLRSEALPEAPEQPAAPARGIETVLVVEDQDEVRHLTVEVLKECGYRALQAGNGRDALKVSVLHEGPIHLLITDVVMPGMSGRQLAEEIRKSRPAIKVLFMSGYTENAAEYHHEATGGHAFLQKPFAPETLALKAREVLGPPRLNARILVADDDDGVRSMIRDILAAQGHDVLEAANGRVAMEILSAQTVDLLITDIVMPEREGIETILELHRTRPELGIIAISGAFGGQFLRAAKLFGAHAAVSKPIHPVRLLTEVERFLLDRRQKQ